MGGATITIAQPIIPFRVDNSGGTISATYSAATTAGQTISATYRYTTSGIAGAFSAGAEHWMAVSVDGVVQETRQRVLPVPFAFSANYATISERLKPQDKKWRPALFSGFTQSSYNGSFFPAFSSNLPLSSREHGVTT
jgi:hypothetical protein